uniref:Tetratricopeptide repeat protein 39B n=1 Tax=Astyanax mexicanus TaxID=7994 RepID=A0A8B9HYK7_ASTMX
MDLKTALNECSVALSLFLNNRFSEALDVLRPWRDVSVCHAMGYGSILAMQAGMTFDPRDMQTAMLALKDGLNTCQKFVHLLLLEMHAELCYAEVLLQMAALSFVEVHLHSPVDRCFSYTCLFPCVSVCQMLSLFPARILRLLEFVGFSGNREVGLSHLRHGAATNSLRSILSAFTLLMFNIYITVILGTGECNLAEAEALLKPYTLKFPKGALMLFYTARIAVLKGEFETVSNVFYCTVQPQ